jgi:hypothetical protein
MNDLWDRIVEGATVVGMVFGGVIYLIFIGVLTGIVFSSLWGWFVVPLGYPQISIFHALGLTTLISILRFDPAKPTPSDSIKEALLKPVIALGTAWLFGFLWHSLM